MDLTDWLRKEHRLLIGGQWVPSVSGQTFAAENPATGEPIAHVAAADAADVDKAVQAARQALHSGRWSGYTPTERSRFLFKLADLIEANQTELAALESLDNGKAITHASFVDLPMVIDMFRYMAGWCSKIEGRTIPISAPFAPGARFHAYTRKEPTGVVGLIIPWNFPLLMAAWKLAPALAAGCTVILKPAEQTPLTALRLGELIIEAGFPEGVVNILTGFGETAGEALVNHPGVNKIAFTGSTCVGKQIVTAAATDLKKLSLELGGKSANIILEDADVEAAIVGAANGIFFNQGQTCTAGSRLYVQRKHFDRVVDGIAKVVANLPIGPGNQPDTFIGPLVSEAQMNRVLEYIEAGKTAGARCVFGGKRHGNVGYFVEPTLFVDVQPGMSILEEEIFGPVVCAIPFDTEEEVIALANSSCYGLAAGIWTRDISRAHSMASRLEAGTVWINCYNICDSAMPFGGYKQSGWGREMGMEAIELYMETKSVCILL